MARLVVTHLSHDVQQRKSFVAFVWSDDATKRLNLEVPYGTTLDEADAAATTAVRALAEELRTAEIGGPE